MLLSFYISMLLLSNVQTDDTVHIRIFWRNQCTNNIEPSVSDLFEKDGVMYRMNENGSWELTKGTYKFSSLAYDFSLTYKVDSDKDDTLNLPRIQFLLEPTSQPKFMNYFDCDDVANGKLIDYYQPGKPRLEARFKKGNLVGSKRIYDFDGTLKKTEKR